jgi:hypothetical protein
MFFVLFLSLERKEPKVQDSKYFLRIALTSLMELNSSPKNNSSVMVSGYFEQQFHFNASFAYSFDENLLRSGEKCYEDRKGFKKSGAKCGSEA